MLLLGCDQNRFEDQLGDYTERLERVLETEPAELVSQPALIFPSARSLIYDIPNADIDLLEFLRLGDCELQSLIAERNSSLGKFAPVSAALAHDVSFVLKLDQCLAQVSDPGLTQTLQSAREHKLKYLDQRLWNALFAGPELRDFWTEQQSGYPDNIEQRLALAVSGLQRQSEYLLSGRLEAFNAGQFESALAILRSGEGADMLRSWQLVSEHVHQATSVIFRRSGQRPLCFEEMRNPKAEYFRNVVVERFVGLIQKDIAVMNQRYYDVVVPLKQLEASFREMEPEAFGEFRVARDKRISLGFQAIQAHVAALQPLMLQCGFIPET